MIVAVTFKYTTEVADQEFLDSFVNEGTDNIFKKFLLKVYQGPAVDPSPASASKFFKSQKKTHRVNSQIKLMLLRDWTGTGERKLFDKFAKSPPYVKHTVFVNS